MGRGRAVPEGDRPAPRGSSACLGIRIPRSNGGSGMDMTSYAICVEEIARCDGSPALTVASHNGPAPATSPRSAATRRRRSTSRRRPPASGWRRGRSPSPAAAATPRGLRTTAPRGRPVGPERHEDVHHAGQRRRLLRRPCAHQPDVAKQKGITAFVVEHGTKGFTASKHLEKLGCRSSDTVELTFDEVVIGDERASARSIMASPTR